MTDRSTHAVYVISVFAEIAGVHPQTLRNYERSGLLSPRRTQGGSRRFSESDLAALRRIQELTADGVNLEGVKRVLKLEAELRAAHEEIERLQARLRHVHDDVQRSVRRDLVPVNNTLAVYVDAMRRRSGGMP